MPLKDLKEPNTIEVVEFFKKEAFSLKLPSIDGFHT